VLAQVGDSRIYRVRANQAVQLTEDHTLIAWQLRQGLITEDQARTSRQRNVITRAVGSRDYVQVDTSTWDAEVGDAYLLCSDGLHGYLALEEIPSIVSEGGDFSVRKLIAMANARGGKDNITALVVESF
jgi:protein phosphatase